MEILQHHTKTNVSHFGTPREEIITDLLFAIVKKHFLKLLRHMNYTSNKIHIILPYFVQRFGFSKNTYSVNDKEFGKKMFLEKSNGTYFE